MITRFLAGSASLALLAACSPAQTSTPDEPAAPGPAAEAGWMADVDLAAFLDCAREQDITFLQAHRAGDRPGAAENSLLAIEASLADGAVFLEIDVAKSSDGVLVLMHDDTVDRTTTGAGILTAMSAETVTGLELVDVNGDPTGEFVPTFEAVLDALDGRGVAQVDLKGITLEDVASALEAGDAVDRAIVITYSLDDAIALHKRLPEVMISVGVRSMDDIATLTGAGVDLTRLSTWLGAGGSGNPALDADLAAIGVETSFGNFRGERNGTADYALMAENGAEVISVDDVPAASAALSSVGAGPALLANCPMARR